MSISKQYTPEQLKEFCKFIIADPSDGMFAFYGQSGTHDYNGPIPNGYVTDTNYNNCLHHLVELSAPDNAEIILPFIQQAISNLNPLQENKDGKIPFELANGKTNKVTEYLDPQNLQVLYLKAKTLLGQPQRKDYLGFEVKEEIQNTHIKVEAKSPKVRFNDEVTIHEYNDNEVNVHEDKKATSTILLAQVDGDSAKRYINHHKDLGADSGRVTYIPQKNKQQTQNDPFAHFDYQKPTTKNTVSTIINVGPQTQQGFTAALENQKESSGCCVIL